MALALGLALAGCARKEEGGPARLALTPCRVEGIAREARCGKLEVWEDRQAKAGRRIALNVVVLPALAPSPAPDPLVLLAGGPGQSAVTEAPKVLRVLERVLRNRDLLLVDQRGTGQSNPLRCDDEPEGQDAGLAEGGSEELDPRLLARCLARYDADVRHYTTAVAMDDLDEVRAALGYPQLNLWGISYGTRAALVYMRQHPGRTRTAILDGVAPLQLKLPLSMAQDAQRATDLLFAACAADATCARTYPDLEGRFRALLAQLEASPARVQVAHPVTGEPEPLVVGRMAFANLVRGMLYMPESATLVPLVLDRASRGDWGPFAAMTRGLRGGMSDSIAGGMMLSVMCSEDVPFFTAEDVARETAGTWGGPRVVTAITDACAHWPRAAVPASFRAPVQSDVPVLLLSGELDPVTPPRWAEEARKTLPSSVHLVLPGVGHGTFGVGCVRDAMVRLVEEGSTAGLDVKACEKGLTRPPFFTSFAGPTP